jgi:hypothetical protein
MPDFWAELAPEARDEIERGDASMAALKRGETIERWHDIGRALVRMQAEAMRRSASNIPKGRAYSDAWQTIAAHAPHLRDIEQSTRSHATWLATAWEPVNAWLQTLAHNVRLQLNHPRAIHRRYDAAHVPPGADKDSGGKAKPEARQHDPMEIVRMLKSGVFAPGISMVEAAQVLIAGLSFDALKRLHAEVGRHIAREERQDRIEAGVKQKARTK